MAQQILPGVGEGQTMNDSFKKIGAELQASRKVRGLRTADVARELRISADYLRLLESGDFDQLPAPTYVSGFLRSYSKFLGLDGAELAGRFYSINGDASSTTNYKLPVTAGPPQRSAPAVASLFVVLALIGYGGWYWISGLTKPDAAAESELTVVETDSKQPGLMEKNAIGERLEAVSQISSGTAPDNRDAPAIIVNDDVTEERSPAILAGVDDSMIASTGVVNLADNAAGTSILAAGAPDSNESAALEAVTSNRTTATSFSPAVTDGDLPNQPVTKMALHEDVDAAAVTSGSVQQLVPGRAAAVATLRNPDREITIRANASSWVEIVRGDGTAVLKKLMRAGETYVVDDGSALYLSTGNAGGIELVTAGNNIITIGNIGEIVRDLPLAKNRLRERF